MVKYLVISYVVSGAIYLTVINNVLFTFVILSHFQFVIRVCARIFTCRIVTVVETNTYHWETNFVFREL